MIKSQIGFHYARWDKVAACPTHRNTGFQPVSAFTNPFPTMICFCKCVTRIVLVLLIGFFGLTAIPIWQETTTGGLFMLLAIVFILPFLRRLDWVFSREAYCDGVTFADFQTRKETEKSPRRPLGLHRGKAVTRRRRHRITRRPASPQ